MAREQWEVKIDAMNRMILALLRGEKEGPHFVQWEDVDAV
jgi:hypothetical protein